MLLRLIFFAVFAFALLMGMSYVVTNRLEVKPGSIPYRLLVPQEWRKNQIEEFAQVERYEFIPEDGITPAVLKIEVIHAQADLFISHMLRAGYVRENPEANADDQAKISLTTWVKAKDSQEKKFIQTDIESPCESTDSCKRTILILQN